jgi:hypothetical protein
MLASVLGHLRHNLIAYIALLVALGSSSYAAAPLFSGSQIKPHSIPKNRLTHKAIAQLKGDRGPRGLRGTVGPAGPVGPPGPAVVLTYVYSPPTALPAGTQRVAVAVCPPGMFVTGGGGITEGTPSFMNSGANISASGWASTLETGPPDQWWVSANNESAGDTTFSAGAVCARATAAGLTARRRSPARR